MNVGDVTLYKKIARVAYDLYERSGRVEGRELDNWFEAESIVRTLLEIAGKDGERYIIINIPTKGKL